MGARVNLALGYDIPASISSCFGFELILISFRGFVYISSYNLVEGKGYTIVKLGRSRIPGKIF